MPRFKHILFPVDFSQRCSAAKPFVTSVAQRFDAKLTLLYVNSIPTGWYGGIDAPYPVMFDIPAILAQGRKQLEAFFESQPASKVDYQVEHGDPAALITAFAHQNDVDLIMMPTHGYGKFRILLLGSVASKVLHDANCPIWNAAHTEDPVLARHIDCKSILCAVDLDPEYAAVIRYAAELAQEFSAKLRIVHAITPTEARADKHRDHELRRNLLEWVGQRVATLQEHAGTNLEVSMESGAVSKVVKAVALNHDADLVVIGRGKIHETFGRLRTHAYAIIRDSPCPVISV